MVSEIEQICLSKSPTGCTGSRGILARGEGQLGKVQVGGSDFLGTIFIPINFYLMNATN